MEIQVLGKVLGLGLRVKNPERGCGRLLRKGCAGVIGLRGDDGSVGVTGEFLSRQGCPAQESGQSSGGCGFVSGAAI